MTRGRIAVIALAVVAVVIAFAGSRGADSGGSERKASVPKPPDRSLHLEFVYSPEKEALVKPLMARFNATRSVSADGRSSSTRTTSRRATPRPRSPRGT